MTPTMSEYFEAWKNSRFVAGDKATEKSFVGASRLQDIADILGGLKLIYANVQPKIEEANQEQAAADRAVAERARGLRGAPARPGGGRQEVHRRGRRHARPPGAGPGRGDRGPDHAGRQAAEHRARDVVQRRLGHRRRRRGARSPRRRRTRRLETPWGGAERVQRGAVLRPGGADHRTTRAPGAARAPGARPPTAGCSRRRCAPRRRRPIARCAAPSASPSAPRAAATAARWPPPAARSAPRSSPAPTR